MAETMKNVVSREIGQATGQRREPNFDCDALSLRRGVTALSACFKQLPLKHVAGEEHESYTCGRRIRDLGYDIALVAIASYMRGRADERNGVSRGCGRHSLSSNSSW